MVSMMISKFISLGSSPSTLAREFKMNIIGRTTGRTAAGASRYWR